MKILDFETIEQLENKIEALKEVADKIGCYEWENEHIFWNWLSDNKQLLKNRLPEKEEFARFFQALEHIRNKGKKVRIIFKDETIKEGYINAVSQPDREIFFAKGAAESKYIDLKNVKKITRISALKEVDCIDTIIKAKALRKEVKIEMTGITIWGYIKGINYNEDEILFSFENKGLCKMCKIEGKYIKNVELA